MQWMKKKEINLTQGSYLKNIMAFAVPVMVTGILQILFNATDSMVVGQFVGDDALAGVSSTGSLFNLITNLFMGISIGANVLVAHFFGARREQDVSEAVHTSVLLSLILGSMVLIIGVVFTKQLLRLMNSPESVIDLSAEYLRVIFIGAPANLLYNFCAAMMRSVGDTRRPMFFLLVASIVNIGLNLLFVCVFSLGVTGVALGTILSQALAAVLAVVTMFRDQGVLKLEWKSLKLNPQKLGMILRIGIPAGIQSAVFSLSNVVIQSAINSFGKAAVAGMGAGYQIEIFVYEAIYAFHHSTLNFVGQNVGAERYERIKKGIFITVLLSSAFCVVLGGGAFLFGNTLLRLYTDSPEAIYYGMIRMTYVVLPYLLLGFMEVSSGAVRGLGASVTPMLVSLIGSCGLRILWVTFVFPLNPTMEMLAIVYPVSWVITTIGHVTTFYILYKRMKKRVQGLPKTRHRAERLKAAKESKGAAE